MMSVNKNKSTLITLDSEQISKEIAEHQESKIKKFFFDVLEKIKKDDDKPMSYDKACDFLDVSKTTLGKWVNEGLIPYTSVDPENPKSKKFFQKKDILEFLDRYKTHTRDEIRRGARNG